MVLSPPADIAAAVKRGAAAAQDAAQPPQQPPPQPGLDGSQPGAEGDAARPKPAGDSVQFVYPYGTSPTHPLPTPSPLLSPSNKPPTHAIRPAGATLTVQRPAFTILSSGKEAFPVQRPIAAGWADPKNDGKPEGRGRVAVLGSAHFAEDSYLNREARSWKRPQTLPRYCSLVFLLLPCRSAPHASVRGPSSACPQDNWYFLEYLMRWLAGSVKTRELAKADSDETDTSEFQVPSPLPPDTPTDTHAHPPSRPTRHLT